MPGKQTSTSEWEKKFVRESKFMPFGSMMNAYGLTNHGKGIEIEKFLEDAEKIYEMSKRLVERALAESQVDPTTEDVEFEELA